MTWDLTCLNWGLALTWHNLWPNLPKKELFGTCLRLGLIDLCHMLLVSWINPLLTLVFSLEKTKRKSITSPDMQQTLSLLLWNSEPKLHLKKANSNRHSVVSVLFLPNELHRYLSISVDWVDYKVQSFRTAYRARTYKIFNVLYKTSTQLYL